MVNENSTLLPAFTGHKGQADHFRADEGSFTSPLREHRSKRFSNDFERHKPSEFTALANRLRSIHLDVSPEDSPIEAGPAAAFGPLPNPMRLEFDEKENISHDKENIRVEVVVEETEKALRTKRSEKQAVGKCNSKMASEERLDEGANMISSATGMVSSFESKTVLDRVPGYRQADNANCEQSFVASESNGTENVMDGTQILTEVALTGSTHGAVAPTEAPSSAIDTDICGSSGDGQTRDVSATCPSALDSAIAEQNSSRYQSGEADQHDIHEEHWLNVENVASCTDAQQLKTATKNGTSAHLPDVPAKVTPDQSKNNATQHDGPVEQVDEHQFVSEAAEKSNAIVLLDMQKRTLSMDIFKKHLCTILDGKEKWGWPKRCEAMSAVASALSDSDFQIFVSPVREHISELSAIVNDNLDELRPSVITSALSLVNSILSCKADEKSKFAEEVFPSVMDLACGRSLTAQEAARSLSLVLELHSELTEILDDADNPNRLCELLEMEAKDNVAGEDAQKRAATALRYVRAATDKNALRPSSSPMEEHCDNSSHDKQTCRSGNSTVADLSTSEHMSRPNAEHAPALAPRIYSDRHSYHAREEKKTPRSMRMSERLEKLTSSATRPSPRSSLRSSTSEFRSASPLVRNMKLGESVRKVSPGSIRKRRLYTEEDMEEARRSAMRTVMEETSQAHAKEREKLQKRHLALEKSLRKERADVAELKSVLGEYELTMQKMVAHGNAKASAYCTSLEAETKKLKAELLEATEAYETIKGRYDAGKQTLAVFEKKEARSIEQIKEMKKNMSELQKWSNDLKANTEKKLAKAFESVTSYRASYMDKEAHLSKATSDLERTRNELEKKSADHAVTVATMAQLEVSLHSEQDAKSSLEASLATCKESLVRMTSQKDRLQQELSKTQDRLQRVTSELSQKEDADNRATDALKQLESFTIESQSLKARAYDDMTRIRDLEVEVEAKEKELDEMGALCEEALSQLEKTKLEGNQGTFQ